MEPEFISGLWVLSGCWYSFTYPRRMESWVSLGGKKVARSYNIKTKDRIYRKYRTHPLRIWEILRQTSPDASVNLEFGLCHVTVSWESTLLANIKNAIILFVCPPIILHKHCFYFSCDLQWSQEKLETMLMQTFGWTNKEYYGIFGIG